MRLGTALGLCLPVALGHISLPGAKKMTKAREEKIEDKMVLPAPLVLQVPENAVRLGAFPCQPIGANLLIRFSNIP